MKRFDKMHYLLIVRDRSQHLFGNLMQIGTLTFFDSYQQGGYLKNDTKFPVKGEFTWSSMELTHFDHGKKGTP